MNFKQMVMVVLLLVLSLPCPGIAADHVQHMESEEGQSLAISAALKDLLNQEMVAIQQGMMDLIPAIAAGEWDQAAAIGKHIKASFIMKQKLSKAQRRELHHVLPPNFIEMDQAFHKSAGMLAHAAEMKNADVLNFYYYKLHDACVSCHAKYATKRFPGLAGSAGGGGHNH